VPAKENRVWSNLMKQYHKASIQYVFIAKQYAEEKGVDRTAIENELFNCGILDEKNLKKSEFNLTPQSRNPKSEWVQSQLDILVGRNEKISLSKILDFWGKVSDLCSDDLLGLNIGGCSHLNTYGIFTQVLINSPSLLQALNLINDYGGVMNDALEGSDLTFKDGVAIYTIENTFDHPQAYHYIDFHFSSIVRLGQTIVPQQYIYNVYPVKVEMNHSVSKLKHDYDDAFKTQVLSNKPFNRLFIKEDVLNIPINAPNKSLFKFFMKHIDYFVSGNKISSKLNKYFSHKKSWDVWPSQIQAAKFLSVSVSTLKRQLNDEGLNYKIISDDYRFTVAKRMLASDNASIAEIAFSLGFSSSAAFSRAFKRYCGFSPSRYSKG
jgi:AraC-like DNA-binding protein